MNYDEDDTIKITSGTVSKISTTSAGNVVVKVGSGKITVKNAADKIVTYIDADGMKNFYPIDFNAKRTAATLLSAYGKDEFDFDDFDGLKNLDASKVDHDLAIVGNKLANKIIGSSGNDIIRGEAGNDALLGGDGEDTILDYQQGIDQIVVLGIDRIESPIQYSSGNVTFGVGDGQIVVRGGSDKYIDIRDGSGNLLKAYIPRA